MADLNTTMTCPSCGHHAVERMPLDRCIYFYDCQGCRAVLKPKAGDCCVYCSYGDTRCHLCRTTVPARTDDDGAESDLGHLGHRRDSPLAGEASFKLTHYPLVEDCSIRATVRMTGASKNTVVKLLAELGAACTKFQDVTMRNLPCKRLHGPETHFHVLR